MFRRLNLNPAAADGGGGEGGAAAANANQGGNNSGAANSGAGAGAGAGQGGANAGDDRLKDTLAKLEATNKRLAELEAAEAKRAEEARKAQGEEARKRGEFETLLKNRDADLAKEREEKAAADRRAKTYARDNGLLAAISAFPNLLDGKAGQLARLWQSDFEAVPDGNSFVVRSLDGRPVADVVRERLASPEYDNFVRASNQGGGGASQGNRTTPTPKPGEGRPPTLLDGVKAKLQEQGHGQRQPGQPFGFRRASSRA